jgi:hypothetical protein
MDRNAHLASEQIEQGLVHANVQLCRPAGEIQEPFQIRDIEIYEGVEKWNVRPVESHETGVEVPTRGGRKRDLGHEQ